MASSTFTVQRAACALPVQTGAQQEVACASCGLDPLCNVLDYAGEQSGLPEGLLLRRRPVARGETLFHIHDPFRSIYAVKQGSFKTFIPRPDGSDQLIGFHLPGELIGAGAMAAERYPCTARALENSRVCEIDLSRLPESGRPLQRIQRAVIELLGQEVAFGSELIAALVHQSAEQRVAGFLISLSDRLQRRGMPGTEFHLSMSRSDIGNYLGLASETVSRILTRFSKAGLIHVRHKRVHLIHANTLAGIACG
ncbi:MAG TPA: cyclic nucleotide-binding domain-containing protein [Sedimenticola sp.]|nr:cyclic nucleotide-binding domain-containing protein [Sedimenticola sp.]